MDEDEGWTEDEVVSHLDWVESTDEDLYDWDADPDGEFFLGDMD